MKASTALKAHTPSFPISAPKKRIATTAAQAMDPRSFRRLKSALEQGKAPAYIPAAHAIKRMVFVTGYNVRSFWRTRPSR